MAGDTRNRHRMRCDLEKCRKRFTLKRHPASYKKLKPCPRCGDTLHVRHVEDERRREMAKKVRCSCAAYPFPYESGTLRFCVNHKFAHVQPNEDEFDCYEACLMTPRGRR